MNYKVSVEDILNRTEHMVLLDNQKEFREQVASFLSMHCLRVRCLNSGFDSSELPRVSMIAIASSGSGKTYVTSRLAEAAGIKVITVDCSSLTRTGWKGVNLGRLIDMEYRNIKDSEAFETCVIHFDEVDKLRYSGDAYSDCNNPQPDFLKIFDGEIHCESDSGGTKKYNTTRMSFLFSGAFSGLEDIIRKRLSPGRAIGFSATTDTVDTTNILSMVTTEDRDAEADTRTVTSIHPQDRGAREVREILPNCRQPNPHTLRLPTSRTGRYPRNRSSRTTHSQNRIKSNNRKVFTPSGYIPPTNSPLRTSRKQADISLIS